ALSNPLMVYVTDAAAGEITFLQGTQQVTRHDRALVARLVSLMGQWQRVCGVPVGDATRRWRRKDYGAERSSSAQSAMTVCAYIQMLRSAAATVVRCLPPSIFRYRPATTRSGDQIRRTQQRSPSLVARWSRWTGVRTALCQRLG